MFQKFLADLQQSLKRLPLEDREKINQYYTEIYFDKKDCGQTDEDIVINFGNVNLIAERILKDYQSRMDNTNYYDFIGTPTYTSEKGGHKTNYTASINEDNKHNTNAPYNDSPNKSYMNTSYIATTKSSNVKKTADYGYKLGKKIILTLLAIFFALGGLSMFVPIGLFIYVMITQKLWMVMAGLIALLSGISFILFGFSSLCSKHAKTRKEN